MSNTIYMVYETTNLVNGKYYVGKHTCDSLEFDGYLGSGTILGIAIRKHGKDNFERAILKSFDNPNDAYEFERKIVNRSFVKNHNTYNIALGGRGFESSPGKKNNMFGLLGKDNPNFGSTRTVESRKRMSDAKKGKYVGEKNNMYGQTHSQEARKKISKARKGTTHSKAVKQKISDGLKGKRAIVECPHCGKTGGNNVMKRWHFDNCKNK